MLEDETALIIKNKQKQQKNTTFSGNYIRGISATRPIDSIMQKHCSRPKSNFSSKLAQNVNHIDITLQ
jgi:hypothetical protein